MSKGLRIDLLNTLNEIKNPSGMVGGKNWLRHDGKINVLFDEMLLSGINIDNMAKILMDRKLFPTEKKALSWIQRHLKHLKSECESGHNLPLIEDSCGKMRFDLKKLG